MKRRIAVLLCVLLAGCVTPPAQVAVTRTSSHGLILVEVDPSSTTFEAEGGILKTLALGYFLTFSRYPSDASAAAPPVLGDWVHVDVLHPLDLAKRFYAAPAPAGTYAFEALNVGGGVSWGACFNRATVAFDVRPGEVVYLGRLAPREIFQDISASLPAALPGGTYRYVFDRTAPALTAPESVQQKSTEIAEFLGRVYPKVQAPLRIGELRPASFQSGTPFALARFPRCAKTG
jgi:hypothetical protein